ncbi:unnamed protein product [marine sediment metagenome]|uniref:Uncharacterized protein n=1 Tax=marine sediment metagenome TaxID=412755 RepID=X1A6Q4_9ZZZZ
MEWTEEECQLRNTVPFDDWSESDNHKVAELVDHLIPGMDNCGLLSYKWNGDLKYHSQGNWGKLGSRLD